MTSDLCMMPAPSGGFGDLAARGRDSVWRTALGLLLILGGAMVIGILLAQLYDALGWHDALAIVTASAPAQKMGLAARLQAFAFIMAGPIASLQIMRIVLPLLHHRPWISFLTLASWRWRRLWGALLLMAALLVLFLLVQLLFVPRTLQFQPNWQEIGLFAGLTILLVPLQVAAEEIFFRGYMMQLTGRITRSMILRLLVPALFFTLAHWQNPEARDGALWAIASYASAAIYLGLLSLLDDGLEASTGTHLAINLFVILVAGSSASVSPSSVIWREDAPDYRLGFLSGLILFALHGACMFRRRFKRRPAASP